MKAYLLGLHVSEDLTLNMWDIQYHVFFITYLHVSLMARQP